MPLAVAPKAMPGKKRIRVAERLPIFPEPLFGAGLLNQFTEMSVESRYNVDAKSASLLQQAEVQIYRT